jgi:hypothetical protein
MLLGKVQRRLIAVLASLVLAAGAIAFSAPHSMAAAFGPVYNLSTSNCLAIYSGTNNAIVYQCNGHADQKWQVVVDPATGWDNIINSNGYCLGVSGGATTNGAQVVQWSCNNHPDQQWDFPEGRNGSAGEYQEITNVGANSAQGTLVCLAIYAGTTNVIIWTCNGHNDQQWDATTETP